MKTTIKQNLILAATALCVGLTSCENLMDVNDPINQINTAQVFESASTADAALSNLYAEMQSNSLISGGLWGTGAVLGSYTDELYYYGTTTQNADMDLYQNVQVASNVKVKSTWSNAYQEIYMANSIIEGIDRSVTISENDRKRIKGEALFIRSFIYFYLSQLFGDLPYTTTTDYNVNKELSKTLEAEVLNKLSADLNQSANLLDEGYRNTERVYPNRKAVEMLLATVLMTRKKWMEAEEILTNIVQSPLYTWEPDVAKTFKMTGKHILWQLKPLKAGNATPEGLLYYFVDTVPNTYTVADPLFNFYNASDLRKQQWIKPIVISGKTYYRANKYRNTVNNNDEYSVVFRLEEVYLLLAEALVQQDKIAKALPYLNAVKQKAGLAPAPSSLTKEEMLTEILNENRKEFFTERGIRFLTLKRAGRLNDLSIVKPNWQSYHQNWPLPLSELLLNPHLNPQNNGY